MDKDKKRLLFGFKSVPFPLRADGVSVRYLPIIEHMARKYVIDILIISGRANELCNLDGLRNYCRKIDVIQDPRRDVHSIFSKCLTYAKFLLPWTPPLAMVAHGGSGITRKVMEAVKTERYDSVVWVGSYLLPNLMNALTSISAGKVVVDFIDSPYLFASRAKEAAFRLRFLERYELWKTCRWEGEVIRKADATIYVSRVDAEAVPSDMAPSRKRHVVPNGVSIPSHANSDRAALPSPNIGFLGNMGYFPNVEALLWLYKEVFVPLKTYHPDLTLSVIGRNPDPSIEELKNIPGVIVTGAVEDIWSYIRAVDVFVFPIWTGAGLKNKVLEAMYAGRPVVTTSIGNEGIEAVPGRDLVICGKSDEFVETVRVLLNSPDMRNRVGSSAHAFVEGKFSWKRILETYESSVVENMFASGEDALAFLQTSPTDGSQESNEVR